MQDLLDAKLARDLIRKELRDANAAMEREMRTTDALIVERINLMQDAMRRHGCDSFTHLSDPEEMHEDDELGGE